MENPHPITQKIEIVKGPVSDLERDAVIAAIIVALGAAAVGTAYAVKKEPRLLSPWKMAADSRIGHTFTDLRLRHQAKKQI
jgi:hypothetical protein